MVAGCDPGAGRIGLAAEFPAAREVPLSLLPATVLKQKAGFHQWPWRRNQNVEGGPLGSGHFTVDLGVGTHPYCEIAFQLPPHAGEFSTLLGLDRSVGRGACAVCSFDQDQVVGRPLFTSEFVRGGEEPIPVGPLRVGAAKRLVLVTEFGDEGRPAGGYPLDIGDQVDWLMPFVNVEESAADRLESLKRFLPGWETWNIDAADVARLGMASVLGCLPGTLVADHPADRGEAADTHLHSAPRLPGESASGTGGWACRAITSAGG